MPTQTPYEQVKQTLLTLTPSQLKDLSNRCKALINVEPDNNDWLLEGIITELRLRGVHVPSLVKLYKANNFASFTEKSLALRTTLEGKVKLSKTEKRQLALICSKCLIDYLQSFTDVSIGTMLDFTHHIPQALERAFPGYLSSNLLLFIVRKNDAGND